MPETQVGIVGAGPAGLMLGELLAAADVETVILEDRSRDYVESRVRAGVLEHGTVERLDALGLGARMHREGLVHHGIYLQFNGERHHIEFGEHTGGKSIMVYGQQEVVKDLIAARLAGHRDLNFEAKVSSITDFNGPLGEGMPTVHYSVSGLDKELNCQIVVGADGYHGVSRQMVSPGSMRNYSREYPYAWLGILAEVEPSTDELIYAFHDRGFAMHSLRSPSVSRLYLQVDPTDSIDAWSDERIWEELQVRLHSDGWSLKEGPVLEKGITPMRSFVTEPMRFGRLFLAGDAAHIVPPTGAKGLNLAVTDVVVLAAALIDYFRSGDQRGLDQYSDSCLKRIWQVQNFSTMMTTLLHLDGTDDQFGRRLQKARQQQVVTSRSAAKTLSENYVGLPLAEPNR